MNLLTILTFLPIVGIALVLFQKDDKSIRWTAAGVCCVEMLLSIWLWMKFDAANPA